jgi:hypothetical protein
MTNIVNQSGKWYVVKLTSNPMGLTVYVKVSPAFGTSYEARAYQLEIVMGRIQI